MSIVNGFPLTKSIYFSVMHGEIIEDNPDDRPYPSCLIYRKTFSGDPVHLVLAYNEENHWAGLWNSAGGNCELGACLQHSAHENRITVQTSVSAPASGPYLYTHFGVNFLELNCYFNNIQLTKSPRKE